MHCKGKGEGAYENSIGTELNYVGGPRISSMNMKCAGGGKEKRRIRSLS